MTIECDIAVIGAGIAGLTAVDHALGEGATVVHVMSMEPMGGLVCNVGELDGYPTGEAPASGIDLASGLMISAAERGAVQMMADATSLARDSDGFRIGTAEGEVRARQIIAATGARLRMLDVPGAQENIGRGVSQCAWCDGALYRDQTAVVVGGGDAALQEALHLAQYASRVIIVIRGTRPRARRTSVERIKTLPNVALRASSEVVAIAGADGVEAVRIVDRAGGGEEEIACRGVFVFIGLEPNAAPFAALAETDDSGGILTDERMQTACPGLYAIGAVRAGYRGRLVHAVGEAATAAMVAAARCR